MQLSDQVISLEQAKKLKELGFERDALFYWIENLAGTEESHIKLATETQSYKLIGKIESSGVTRYYQSYTVSELMEYLPHQIGKDMLHIEKVNTDDGVLYFINYGPNIEIVSRTLAEALGDMLIYLITNNYIKCN